MILFKKYLLDYYLAELMPLNIQNVINFINTLINKILLLIYILINIFKDYATINLQLIWIDVVEVVRLLMT